MLLMINYFGNYAGIMRISKQDYSSASFKLIVVCAVMSRQLTLFRKVAASRKVYGKPTNKREQFVNAFVADERRCSPSLPLQQAKKLIGGWCMESGRPWQGRGGCVRCSILQCEWRWVRDKKLDCSSSEIPIWYVDTEIHTFAFKATNSSILVSEKVRFVFGWERGVTPMWKTLRSENKCELMRWPLNTVQLDMNIGQNGNMCISG